MKSHCGLDVIIAKFIAGNCEMSVGVTKRKFLILSQYFPPEIGGPQTRLGAMAQELMRQGHGVEVVTAFPNYPKGKFFEEYGRKWLVSEHWHGMKVHRVWLYPSVGSGLKRLFNFLSFSFTAFLGLSRATKPDYVFVESPPLFVGLTGWIAARWWGVPWVLNVADPWVEAAEQMGILRKGILLWLAQRFQAWLYRKADFVTTVTEGLKLALLQAGVLPEKVLFLPNGVDPEAFKPGVEDSAFKEQLGLAGKQIALYAGNHGYAQGVDAIIRAAKKLQESQKTDFHFLFVGDGSLKSELIGLVEKWKLENVTFLPPVSPQELTRYFSISLCGLVCLKNLELFRGARPSKLFPLMASRIPVIFCGEGEGAKIVEEAGAGFVVSDGCDHLVEVLERLASDSSLCLRLGQNGRAHVEKYFSWQTLVGDWLERLSSRPGVSYG